MTPSRALTEAQSIIIIIIMVYSEIPLSDYIVIKMHESPCEIRIATAA